VITAVCLFLGIEQGKAQNNLFSIYCTSNFDGTGKCRRIDDDSALSCIVIPGGIIACRDESMRKYECVQFGAIIASQTQFSCVLDDDNSVDDKMFEPVQPKSKLKLPVINGGSAQGARNDDASQSGSVRSQGLPPSPPVVLETFSEAEVNLRPYRVDPVLLDAF
jgi:hypothetical protein